MQQQVAITSQRPHSRHSGGTISCLHPLVCLLCNRKWWHSHKSYSIYWLYPIPEALLVDPHHIVCLWSGHILVPSIMLQTFHLQIVPHVWGISYTTYGHGKHWHSGHHWHSALVAVVSTGTVVIIGTAFWWPWSTLTQWSSLTQCLVAMFTIATVVMTGSVLVAMVNIASVVIIGTVFWWL